MSSAEETKKSKASWLLLPMMGNDCSYFDFERLVDCYSSYREMREYNKHLFLLYSYGKIENLDTDELQKINDFEEKLQKDHNNNKFIDMIDVSTEHSLFIYELNEKYIKDFEIFKSSKYSKLSPEYKEQIIKFHTPENRRDLTAVLNRDQTMLRNIHKNLGCRKVNKGNCKCTSENYTECRYFDYFKFDFNKHEVWSLIGRNEELTKDKYKI